MRRVILESPFEGEVEANVAYARKCLKDCLDRGEAPIASHLLYTQVLDDNNPADRNNGIRAGWAWLKLADAVVVYVDKGISLGMELGIDLANRYGVEVEHRKLF